VADAYVVTESDFHAAVNGAGYWARKRLFKKMEKRVYRPKTWRGEFIIVDSPLRVDDQGQPIKLKVLNKEKPNGVFSGPPRPPKDLETWVTSFVLTHKDKHEEKA
jgi:hypothetical protein